MGSGSFTQQKAEALTQLSERTASIQLLRDKMYQTCLAFANGAISGTTYTLIMSELDRTIVTLLLGENAAGAFGRTGASIGSSAEGDARSEVSGNATAMADLEEATEKMRLAQQDLDAKRDALETAKKSKGAACQVAKDAKTDATDPNCIAIGDAQVAHDDALGTRDARQRLLTSTATTTVKGSAKTDKIQAVGGLTRTPTPQLAAELRAIQDNFLSTDPTDTFLPACLVELGVHDDSNSGITRVLDELSARMSERQNAYDRASGFYQTLESSDGWSLLSDPEKAERRSNATKALTDAETARREVLASFDAFLRNPQPLLNAYRAEVGENGEPARQVFNKILTRWQDGVDEAKRDARVEMVDTSDLAAAMNLNRRSTLARLCMQELPAHLTWARRNAQSFRKERLERHTAIDARLADAKVADARATLISQFQNGLKTCEAEAVPSGEKGTCRAAVYAATPPTAPVTADLLAQFQSALKACAVDGMPPKEREECRAVVYAALRLATSRSVEAVGN